MALLLGFTEQVKGNTKQEVSASVIATSADSVDMHIEFPEVFKETFTTYINMQNLYWLLCLHWCVFFSVFWLVYSLPPCYSISTATCPFSGGSTGQQQHNNRQLWMGIKTSGLHKISLIRLNWIFVKLFCVLKHFCSRVGTTHVQIIFYNV